MQLRHNTAECLETIDKRHTIWRVIEVLPQSFSPCILYRVTLHRATIFMKSSDGFFIVRLINDIWTKGRAVAEMRRFRYSCCVSIMHSLWGWGFYIWSSSSRHFKDNMRFFSPNGPIFAPFHRFYDFISITPRTFSNSLQWRHNERDVVSNHQPHDCLLNRLFTRISKKTSKFRVTGLCEGNSPVTGEFPAQRVSNAENVSIWWRHHVIQVLLSTKLLGCAVGFHKKDSPSHDIVHGSDNLYLPLTGDLFGVYNK